MSYQAIKAHKPGPAAQFYNLNYLGGKGNKIINSNTAWATEQGQDQNE